jgi:hypothetical protein
VGARTEILARLRRSRTPPGCPMDEQRSRAMSMSGF